MSRPRRIATWCIAILLLLLAACAVVVATLDWNLLKPTINSQVSDALGRRFVIDGNLAVDWRRDRDAEGWHRWVPMPHVSAEDVSLANPDWAQNERFVHLGRVEADIDLLALLGQRVHVPRIALTGAEAHVERLKDGANSWTFEKRPTDEEKSDADKDEPSAWTVDLGTIQFDHAAVSYDDQMLNANVAAEITPLGEPVPFQQIMGAAAGGKPSATDEGEKTEPQDYAFAWQASGRYKGQPVKGEGRIGGLLAMQDAAVPFPVQVNLRAGNTQLGLVGTLTDPRNLGALDLRLHIEGDSLDNLYPLTGLTLPATGAYATDGRLLARLQDADGPTFRYQDFNGRIGSSDIHGDLSFSSQPPRPKLTGRLTSNQLLFSDLAPLIGADSNEAKQERGTASKQPEDKLLPVEEFQTARWRDMDADVRFEGKRIVQNDALPITDMQAHVVLEDGNLKLTPLNLGVAGGTLGMDVNLDGRQSPLRGQVGMKVRGLKLKQLFPTVETMQDSLGELNGDAKLGGAGNSVAALLGSANGDLRVLMNDGTISSGLMELAGLNVGNYLMGRLFGDDEVTINCAVSDIGIKDGLATTRAFVFDTENAVISVDGTVNFKTEAMDLDVVPRSKGLRIISLRSPLYVHGTLKNPSPGVHAAPLALRGAGMLVLGATVGPAAGLLALIAPSGGQDDQCGPLLEEVRKAR